MSPHNENSDPVLRVLHDMRTSVKRLTIATIALYLFGAITFGTAVYLLNERTDDNRRLVRQAEEDRAENRARFKRSDVLLCREIEQLKTFNRDDAQKLFRFRIQAIRSLGILTPEVETAALDNLYTDLLRNEARENGCGDLPSGGAGG